MQIEKSRLLDTYVTKQVLLSLSLRLFWPTKHSGTSRWENSFSVLGVVLYNCPGDLEQPSYCRFVLAKMKEWAGKLSDLSC